MTRTQRAGLALFILAMGFLLYRPYVMQQSGLVYGGDDYNYLAHATALAYGNFPDYSKEAYSAWPIRHTWGPGLLASPFVALFSCLDRLQNREVVAQRTDATVRTSWTAFGFVFATLFYFVFALWLLILIFKALGQTKGILPAIALCGFSAGLPLYVYRRPVFSHLFEFWAVTLALFFLVRLVAGRISKRPNLEFGGMVLSVSLLYLIRNNDLLLGIAFLIAYLWARWERGLNQSMWRDSFLAFGVYAGVIAMNQVLIERIIHTAQAVSVPIVAGSSPANHWATVYQILTSSQSVSYYLERFFHILMGPDWGLIYTAPLALLGLIGFRYLPHSRFYVLPLVAVLANFYMCMRWGTQGSWYGYRYLVFVLLPFSIVGFAWVWERLASKRKIWILSLVCLLSVPPFLSMLAFEGNSTTLTLAEGETKWERGWVNNTYQIEVWKSVVHAPKEIATALLKGGPLYAVYLGAEALGKTSILPADVRSRYPVFSVGTLVKSLILCLFPFLLLIPLKADE